MSSDVLNQIMNTIYNIGASFMTILGFQQVIKNGTVTWKAPSFNDFVTRVIEILIVALIVVFIVKRVLLNV